MSEEKILLVDDDKHLLRAMERIFRKRYTVMTASSGKIALQRMLDEGPFSVVICDMMMPHMDGLEFLKIATKKAPDCVYMMLSGNASLETAVQALNDGLIFKYFSKPSPMDEITDAIDQAIQEYHLNVAKQNFTQFVTNTTSPSDVEGYVADKLIEESEALQHEASCTLIEVQKKCDLEMTRLKNKAGKACNLYETHFDPTTRKKIEKIESILGTSPDVIAKIDILLLGQIASHIYQNISRIQNDKLIVEVHFSTLYHRRYLEMYLRICRSLIDVVRDSLSIKVIDVPGDILPSRLTELLGRIRPFTQTIFVDLSDVTGAERFVKELANVVLTFDCDKILNPEENRNDIKKLLSSMSHCTNQVYYRNCPDLMMAEFASKARLDYCS